MTVRKKIISKIKEYLKLRGVQYSFKKQGWKKFLFTIPFNENKIFIKGYGNILEYDNRTPDGIQYTGSLNFFMLSNIFSKLAEDFNFGNSVVESIEVLDLTEELPVYDIEVPGYHNFILSNGLVAHNSVDTIQQFKLQNFNSYTLSVDKSKEPYIALKNAVNEGRLIAPKISLLEKEYADVEDDTAKNKIDHTPNGCLTKDTLIKVKGGNKPIYLLSDEDIIYSYSLGNLIESSFKNLRITRQVKNIYKISLRNGSFLECTENHPILTLKGYKQAQELSLVDLLVVWNKERESFFIENVKAIEKAEYPAEIPVYDIEVPEYHNFVLENGIVVHNSKDILDSVAANVFKAGTFSAPQITSNTANSLLDLNTFEEDEEDLESWILPDGYSVVEF